MAAIEIKKNITWVGALDWDRRLFDELIPLPDGTSSPPYIETVPGLGYGLVVLPPRSQD